ncbi:NADP-dependent oxidoreductase [Myxococcota bacterium]|nr:NADP-dependent oxidoreductase [Myxococcota bacterium]
MTKRINQKWVLAQRPTGEPTDDCFRLEEETVGELADGEILVQVHYLSLDPYMRGRMREGKSYAEPIQIGEIITGECAGVVIESRSARWNEGDTLTVHEGWQSLARVHGDAATLLPADPDLAPLSAWLGVVGMPGRTAYFGLERLGKPQSGETLVVSAASGAVGSVVGQLGRLQGLRVVGVAGGPEKSAYCVDELGFDACVDYKAGRLEDDLKKACPDGVDIYFENVGGALTRAVAPLFNEGARAPICGFISLYNSEEDMANTQTPFHVFGGLESPPEHRFFLVREWFDEWLQASAQIAQWVRSGDIQYRETVAEGLAAAPAAFRGLLNGQNFGKQLVRVAD